MRRLFGATAEALIIVILVFGLLAVPVLAAKGGNGGGGGKPGGSGDSTLTLVLLAPPTANWGEQVTFEVSTTATVEPHVTVSCYQAGALVYSASAGFYAGYPWPWNQFFTLSSRAWSAGPADCTAELSHWDGRRFRTLTSLGFAVDP